MSVSQSLTLSQKSQDPKTATSQIRVLWQSSQTGESYNNNSRTAKYWVDINGTETEYTVTYTLPQKSTVTILDTTITAKHDAQGKCVVKVRTEMDTRISAGVVRKSATIIPTPIALKSSVSAGRADVGSELLINIDRLSTSYTHELKYEFGGLTGVIATGINASSYAWQLPDSFYLQMPDTTTKKGKITCTTYSGSNSLGSTTTEFTAVVGEENAPELTAVYVRDINPVTLDLTGNEKILIRGFSNAEIVTVVNLSPGASIVKTEILCGDGQKTTGTVINAVASGQFQVTVTDSRGMTGQLSAQNTLIEYMPVTCNLAARGPDEITGAAPIILSGVCFGGSFGAKSNYLSINFRYKEDGGLWNEGTLIGQPDLSGNKYKIETAIPNLDYNKIYVIQYTVNDALTNAQSNEQRVRTIPVFDWGESDFNFNVPPIVSIPETGKKYNVLGACRALSESFSLNTSITPGGDYSECTGGATLLGNCLRLNFSATRKSSPPTGNISDETIATFSINHGGKIGAVYATHFPIIQGQGTGNITNVSNSDGVLTLDLRLTGIETATTSISSYFIVPVRLNLDYFI